MTFEIFDSEKKLILEKLQKGEDTKLKCVKNCFQCCIYASHNTLGMICLFNDYYYYNNL